MIFLMRLDDIMLVDELSVCMDGISSASKRLASNHMLPLSPNGHSLHVAFGATSKWHVL